MNDHVFPVRAAVENVRLPLHDSRILQRSQEVGFAMNSDVLTGSAQDRLKVGPYQTRMGSGLET